jgi:DNA gyrase/topoisomerase IV subunit A
MYNKQRGWIKKTPLSAFASTNARGLTIITLEDGDELLWVKVTHPLQPIELYYFMFIFYTMFNNDIHCVLAVLTGYACQSCCSQY